MPNQCEPANLYSVIDFVPLRPLRFSLMFHRDEQGRCVLRMNSEEWAVLNEARRDDWNGRLKRLLKASGSYGDLADARKYFGVDL